VATDFGGLIDAEKGLISRRILIEPEIYVQELERFSRCWRSRQTEDARDCLRQACSQ
jgi:hypothetical protein